MVRCIGGGLECVVFLLLQMSTLVSTGGADGLTDVSGSVPRTRRLSLSCQPRSPQRLRSISSAHVNHLRGGNADGYSGQFYSRAWQVIDFPVLFATPDQFARLRCRGSDLHVGRAQALYEARSAHLSFLLHWTIYRMSHPPSHEIHFA